MWSGFGGTGLLLMAGADRQCATAAGHTAGVMSALPLLPCAH